MNYKFRKKPVIVEAFQMTVPRRWNNIDWPAWLNAAWGLPHFREGALYIDPDHEEKARLVIRTLEGVQRIAWNDWIIRGIKGELYACKPDIFEATYESV